MAERICDLCGQPELSHPVSPELQCEKFVPPPERTPTWQPKPGWLLEDARRAAERFDELGLAERFGTHK